MQGRRQLVDRSRTAEKQHRHARQVSAIEGEDLGRDDVESVRFFLETHDLGAEQRDVPVAWPRAVAPRRSNVRPRLLHPYIISDTSAARHGAV